MVHLQEKKYNRNSFLGIPGIKFTKELNWTIKHVGGPKGNHGQKTLKKISKTVSQKIKDINEEIEI